MDIELGIANVARPVTFSTEEDAASVTEAIESALSAGTPIKLTDDASSCRRTRSDTRSSAPRPSTPWASGRSDRTPGSDGSPLPPLCVGGSRPDIQ